VVRVASWGRLSCVEHTVIALADRGLVSRQLGDSGVAYGMGRSYGDVCLNPGGRLWLTRGLDRFIAFDPDTGRLRCEAGVLLREIQDLFVQRGWMLPVTPGTQLVTVGGAIANDVHGKNHHVQGSFGDHVLSLSLVRTDGELIECRAGDAWFSATVGGLGLTGLIVAVELQLRPVAGPWLDAETLPFSQVDEFFALADASEEDWEHTVSWIDCVGGKGRGLFMRANHAAADEDEAPKIHAHGLHVTPPFSLVNRWSLQAFNNTYYFAHRIRAGQVRRAHYRSFFYPLDHLDHWNRMYGPSGFFQYQCVVPRDGGADAIRAMLARIASAGEGSFLAVLKTFGNRAGAGMLSFPRPGVTLALDFPNLGERTCRLFDGLDAIVREVGGGLYPAKDARMPATLFAEGFPKLEEFQKFRDPGISSAMSRRLMGS
jgi:FAD/FMN-containing dehydrogenase